MQGELEKRITIVVTQRERMSAAREALDALYANTAIAFDLIYVVGHVSSRNRRWLQSEAVKRSFQLVEARRSLTPAEARNLGAAQAKTEFVLFIENDVVAQTGLRTWFRVEAELLRGRIDRAAPLPRGPPAPTTLVV